MTDLYIEQPCSRPGCVDAPHYVKASPAELQAAYLKAVEEGTIEGAEPDYEAALKEYLRLAWAKDGLGPYAEELADKVLPNGVKVPIISNFEEAQRIVDTSLAGRVVVREEPNLSDRLEELAEKSGLTHDDGWEENPW